MEIQENLSLESKKNNHKVVITDIAISKVPFVEYRSIPKDHYSILQEIEKYFVKFPKAKCTVTRRLSEYLRWED